MSVKALKTIALTNGLELEVISGTPAAGSQTDEIVTTTLADATVTKCPRYQTEDTDLTLLCAYDGTLATIGDATLVVTATEDDDGTLVHTVAGFISAAIPQEVAIDGERRMVQQITFTPDGSSTLYTTT
jgi:hypothetical protein